MDEQTTAPQPTPGDTLRVITVRIKRHVHEAVKKTAHRQNQSMNEFVAGLCEAATATAEPAGASPTA